MARTRFEDLRIYQLSEMVADEIWDFVRRWDNFAKDTVGKQLVRSADSIGANIAEGVGRGTYKDNRHFARTARGSLNETKHWLRRAFRRALLDQKVVDKLKPLIDELAPKLNAYLRYLNKKSAASERPRATPITTNNSQLATNNSRHNKRGVSQ